MKTLFIAISAVAAFAFTYSESSTLNLQQALKEKTVFATFNGKNGSPHYLKPLQAQIRNLKNKEVTIHIPAGYHFKSEDETTQDIIITQEQLIVLAPKEVLEVPLSGMCIQHHNGSPNSDDGFVLAGWASPKLKKLAIYLDEENIQTCQAQQAMWAISDGESLANLVYNNMDGNRDLIDATCDILERPRYTDAEFERLLKQQGNTVYKAEIRGKFSFKFSRKVPIHIALFDDNGIVLKEIYKEEVKPGRHNVEYTFDAVPYQGETIHAKLIAFDDVLLDRTIEL